MSGIQKQWRHICVLRRWLIVSVGSYWCADWFSGGLNNLSEMSDVTITSAQDKDILVYDSGTSKWVNEAPVIEQWESGTLTYGATQILWSALR